MSGRQSRGTILCWSAAGRTISPWNDQLWKCGRETSRNAVWWFLRERDTAWIWTHRIALMLLWKNSGETEHANAKSDGICRFWHLYSVRIRILLFFPLWRNKSSAAYVYLRFCGRWIVEIISFLFPYRISFVKLSHFIRQKKQFTGSISQFFCHNMGIKDLTTHQINVIL